MPFLKGGFPFIKFRSLTIGHLHSSKGEITATLTLIGIAILTLGTLLGAITARNNQSIRSTAATSCKSFEATDRSGTSFVEGSIDYSKPGYIEDTDDSGHTTPRREVCTPRDASANQPAQVQEYYCDNIQGGSIGRTQTKYCKDVTGADACATINAGTDNAMGYCLGTSDASPTPLSGNVSPIPTPTGIPATWGITDIQVLSHTKENAKLNVTYCTGTFQGSAQTASFSVEGQFVLNSQSTPVPFNGLFDSRSCKTSSVTVNFNQAYLTNTPPCPSAQFLAKV